MAEYDDLTASMRANEELGEGRLNAYLTVIAAVTAAIGLAAGRFQDDISSLIVVVVVASALVLILGLMTLRRVMGRNVTTSGYMNGLRRIRAFLLQTQPAAARIVPFPPERVPVQRKRENLWGLGKAGLLETVAAVNCGLIAMIAAGSIRLAGGSVPLFLPAAFIAAALGWLAQMKWAMETYKSVTLEQEDRRQENLDAWERRAAAVVPLEHDQDRELFRAGVGLAVLDQRGLVLTLERSDVPGAWQLPQGGIKFGEGVTTAAWRELKEETGLGPDQVVLERTSDVWMGYELPQEFRSEKTGRGQVHRWHLFRLQAAADLPLLPSGSEAEFLNSRWVTFPELLDHAVDFRRATYEWLASWIEGS